ncbi:hypothetical protein ABU952_18715 [Bacillus amyloliquefaciens]|uniref:hypothetical protein n=1 Tax=Bacillus amyloliquefaciens TaxID=1390 RepID=UPI00336B6ECF
MPDINIKSLSKNTCDLLTDKARKAGLSQQEYIRQLLDKHVVADEVEGVRSELGEVIKSVTFALEQNTKALNEFIRVNEG